MKKIIKNTLKVFILSVILVMLLSGTALAAENSIEIMVSPNVINLDSNGGSFSIHADIAYSIVDNVHLYVGEEEIGIGYLKYDDRGDLVVKNEIQDVKEKIEVGNVNFKLIVETTLSEVYTGYDMVRVISCGE